MTGFTASCTNNSKILRECTNNFKVHWKKNSESASAPNSAPCDRGMEEQKRKRAASELEPKFTVKEIVNICADYCGIVASRNASDQSALNRALEYKEGKDGLYRWLEKNYPCIKTTVSVGPTEDSDDSDETPVMGPAVPTGFGEKDWMKKRGLLYGADDPNSWVKKPSVAQESKEEPPENTINGHKPGYLAGLAALVLGVTEESAAGERNSDGEE